MRRKQMIWTILYIGFMLFIFSNSLQNAADSSSRSGAVLKWLQEVFGSGWITEHIVRKSAHFLEFMILGAIGLKCFGYYGFSVLPALFAGLLTAMTDETIQRFVEGRSSQLTDVWLDFAGCVTGVFVIWLVRRLRGSRNAKETTQEG